MRGAGFVITLRPPGNKAQQAYVGLPTVGLHPHVVVYPKGVKRGYVVTSQGGEGLLGYTANPSPTINHLFWLIHLALSALLPLATPYGHYVTPLALGAKRLNPSPLVSFAELLRRGKPYPSGRRRRGRA